MKLKIGGHSYEVQFVEGLGISLGILTKTEDTIKISEELSVSQQESTLLHEILHAVADNFGLDLPEQTISILEGGLYQVLKDNYDLDLLNIKNNKKEE